MMMMLCNKVLPYIWAVSWFEDDPVPESTEVDSEVPGGNGEFWADKSNDRTIGLFSLSIHDFDFFREKAFVIELLSYDAYISYKY